MKFSCPKCDKALKASDGMAGKRGKCPACGEKVVVPGSPSPLPAANAPPVNASAGTQLTFWKEAPLPSACPAAREEPQKKPTDAFEDAYNEGWATGRMCFAQLARMAQGDVGLTRRMTEMNREHVMNEMRALHPDNFRRAGYEEGIRDGLDGKPSSFISGSELTL